MMTTREHMEAVIGRCLRLAQDHWGDKELRCRYLAQARRARNALRTL